MRGRPAAAGKRPPAAFAKASAVLWCPRRLADTDGSLIARVAVATGDAPLRRALPHHRRLWPAAIGQVPQRSGVSAIGRDVGRGPASGLPRFPVFRQAADCAAIEGTRANTAVPTATGQPRNPRKSEKHPRGAAGEPPVKNSTQQPGIAWSPTSRARVTTAPHVGCGG
ncbi:hypothetical protein GCM10022402_01930 [Salinactinospora qingdaonensis]|uniref:Uncharacterized protein n=1 Tax=Salinactinospora qingdaonensis TaxID=702744 RepID=A0ABP7EV20_9ACTN